MPQIKLKPGAPPTNGEALGEFDESVLITRVGDAIADAASGMRNSDGEEAREAARRAAVDIATAALVANSADTAAHSEDVDVISEGVARQLGLSGQRLGDVITAARLHDIGKLGVPAKILKKPGSLNPLEWTAIHRHTIVGEQILLAVPELRGAARLVRHSHERWDGKGYPDGLAGDEIPLGSRIVFCADAFHAIRSDRPYRKGRSAAETLAEIEANAGTQFDPAVVEALVALSGDLRALSNGDRPRAVRARRLFALLLIVSVGTAGSAFARSGLMREPTSHTHPAAGVRGAGHAAAVGPGAGGQSATSLDAGKRLAAASPGSVFGAVGSSGPLTLLSPGAGLPGVGLVSGPTALLPSAAGTATGDQTPSDAGPASSQDRPGVRDHGQGLGNGRGQGKGRGASQGRRHDQQSSVAAASDGSSNKGKAKGHSGSSGSGKAKSNGGSSKSTFSAGSTTKGNSSNAGSGGGSSHGKSGQGAGGGQSSAPPKPPKSPPPAPDQSSAPPPASGNGNAGGNGGGNASARAGNAGGNGNAGGQS